MANRRALLWARGILSVGLAAGALLGWGGRIRAQEGSQEGYVEETPAAQERERLYDALAKQAVEFERQYNVVKKVVKLVSPTVVHIKAEKLDQSTPTRRFQREKIEEAGSGVVIDHGGKFYVLTNRHVIKEARNEDIGIGLADGREIHPIRVWGDAATDVAVMEVSAKGLAAARLGDSDKVEIGDFVLAVGSPFGLSHSVTYGIISAKGRRDLELGDEVELQDFLQTDAAINPGNSGGPLINLRGEVIGLNTAIASNSGGNEGIGFSIPINGVLHIARQFIEKGRVVRAYLGITLNQRFNHSAAMKLGLPRKLGAQVTMVKAGGPAQAAKLRAGDVVLSFNGARVENDAHLIYLVSLTEVGREVPLVIYREGKTMDVMVRVGNKSDFER